MMIDLIRVFAWCDDHCKKSEHLKETYWVLHGKPQDWKPHQERESSANITQSERMQNQFTTSFSKDQFDILQQLIFKATFDVI